MAKRSNREIIIDMFRELSNRMDMEVGFSDKPMEQRSRELLSRAEGAIHLAWPTEANKPF